ncbi:protein MAIN-LIKE 2-like [Daucus carota subsp. sativus]|uniref:protein MAIN-LIKE 2-like n=2 Tax=Daucus carota subsp. sativus TaxID=79200 RepID=UPI0007EFF8EC|nr:PREDICTED: uncharacterized protein LOC108223531 [Daucus carota subsp. sativus]
MEAGNTSAVVAAGDALVEQSEEVMVPTGGGNPTLGMAHLMKPLVSEDILYYPPPPTVLIASNPNSQNLKKWCLKGSKTSPKARWNLWVNSLEPRYGEIWRRSGIYQAIKASTYSVPRDKMLLLGFAEFWCCDTNTFVFPWGEVTITLEDILHLGSLSVIGCSILTPFDNDECGHVYNCLRNEIKQVKRDHGESVTPHMWMDHFVMNPGKEVEHEAFLLCWLSKFVFLRTQILVQDVNVAIHLSRGTRVALAPVVLAYIYRDMSVLHNAMGKPVESGSRIGKKFVMWHYDLVQMWVWERFPEMRPNPKVIERGDPRAARWNGVPKLNLSDYRTALNNASILLYWRPYSLIQSESMLSNLYKDKEQWVVVESDAVEAFARCLRASNLNGLGYTEPYFPQRVARQFGLDQDIPLLDRNIALGSYDRPIRGVRVYIPPRDFESDVTARYNSWWKGLLAVNENYVDNSNHEQQLLALLPCGHQSNAESFAAPGSLSGCVMQSLEAGPSTAQLNSQLGKPDGYDKSWNGLGNDPALSSDDDVDEDSLTIAQYLNRSRKRDVFENARDVGNEHVLNTGTSNLMALAICPDTTNGLTCTSEPLEMSVPSFKGKKSKLSSDKQA